VLSGVGVGQFWLRIRVGLRDHLYRSGVERKKGLEEVVPMVCSGLLSFAFCYLGGRS